MPVQEPEDVGAMIFKVGRFTPQDDMKVSEMVTFYNYLIAHMFQKDDGGPLDVSKKQHPLIGAIDLVRRLDLNMKPEMIDSMPENMRRHFSYLHRDGITTPVEGN